jgi:hypothetical protein
MYHCELVGIFEGDFCLVSNWFRHFVGTSGGNITPPGQGGHLTSRPRKATLSGKFCKSPQLRPDHEDRSAMRFEDTAHLQIGFDNDQTLGTLISIVFSEWPSDRKLG